MVIPVGTLINGAAVVAGSCIGMLLGNRLTEGMKTIVFQGLSLCTLVIGLDMALKSGNMLFVIGSIVLGGIIGEFLDIDAAITRGSDCLKNALKSSNSRFTQGFVSATLLFCIGSMAILGPLQEGLEGNRTIVLTKTMLDFFAAIAFGAAFGSGVAFSALPIVLYQGAITLFAETLRPILDAAVRTELAAVGGILIVGISINLLEVKSIKLSNFLPALVIVVLLCTLAEAYPIAIP